MKRAVACLGWLALPMIAIAPVRARDSAPSRQPRSLAEIPCPPMPVVSPERMRLIVEPRAHIAAMPPASERDRAAYARWSRIDPDGLCRYREENASLPPPTDHRVVFLGDSITESWKLAMPSLFTGDVLDRGVSGQTTAQMLARFRADVIDIHPAVVHIMGGVNDIARGLAGAETRSNLRAMVDLARAHGITVILGAVTPSSFFQGAPERRPGPEIAALDRWLRDFARRRGLIFVDYHRPLRDGALGIRDGLSNDGLHPNRRGFAIMSPLARAAVDRALRRRHSPPPAS